MERTSLLNAFRSAGRNSAFSIRAISSNLMVRVFTRTAPAKAVESPATGFKSSVAAFKCIGIANKSRPKIMAKSVSFFISKVFFAGTFPRCKCGQCWVRMCYKNLGMVCTIHRFLAAPSARLSSSAYSFDSLISSCPVLSSTLITVVEGTTHLPVNSAALRSGWMWKSSSSWATGPPSAQRHPHDALSKPELISFCNAY